MKFKIGQDILSDFSIVAKDGTDMTKELRVRSIRIELDAKAPFPIMHAEFYVQGLEIDLSDTKEKDPPELPEASQDGC